MYALRALPCSALESADFEQASDFAVRGCCVWAFLAGAAAGAAILDGAAAAEGFAATCAFIAAIRSLSVGFAAWVVCAKAAVDRSAVRAIVVSGNRSMRVIPFENRISKRSYNDVRGKRSSGDP
jgi:hypothetical protein